MATLKEFAYNYVAEGFAVFPVKLDKKPLTEHGLKDATKLRLGVDEYWTRWPDAGIAIVTDGLMVLDFDTEHGGLNSKLELESKHGQLPRTRAHKTGGGGIHLIYRQPNGHKARNTVKLGGYEGVDLRADGGYIVVPPSPHLSGNYYELMDKSDIVPAPAWLVELTQQRPIEGSPMSLADSPIPEGQRNHTLLGIAGAMRRRGSTQSAIEAALLEENRQRCNPPLSETDVRKIVTSVSRYAPEPKSIDTKRYKNVTKEEVEANQAQAIKEWVKDQNGWWETGDLDREIGLTTPVAKLNRRVAISRLKAEGIIEQHGKIAKRFRYVNRDLTSIVFQEAKAEARIPIIWPLGIENLVHTYPGNVIVVAGSPDAGKTAFCLNLIYHNMESYIVNYFCSEMGAEELRSRLDKFPNMHIYDWHFNAYDRSVDFEDVVKPNQVNIIDYLEITDELWAVNTHLTAISHKIGNGLAIVALQKKKGAEMGRGQEFSLEKPKLYLSMDRGKISIVKGKAWVRSTVDPKGLQRSFRIIDGCQFEPSNEWNRPGEVF